MVSSKDELKAGPPAYSSVAPAPASPRLSDLSHPPTWRLIVHESMRPIEGTYAVDAGKGPGATGSQSTASLTTSNFRIDVVISVLGAGTGECQISAVTSNAPISLAIPVRESAQPLAITLRTSNAPIKFSPPQDFAGTVTWKTSNASFEIAPSWKSRVFITSMRGGQGEAQVVRADDPDGTGPPGQDELTLTTANAKILLG